MHKLWLVGGGSRQPDYVIASNSFYLHSHTAGGQREILCTHAALAGATTAQIQQLYAYNTTTEMQELLAKMLFGKALQMQRWRIARSERMERCKLD